MGILSGQATTTRYKLDGELSAEAVIEGIKKFRFPEIEDDTAEYMSGWASPVNAFVPDFDSEILNACGYLVFTLRIDKKNIPSSSIKKYVALESDRRIKQPGKEFLSKAEKKEIKEQVTEMLSRKIPLQPDLFDVLVDLNEGVVSLFTSSQSISDAFETLFYKSFSVRLIRLFPFTLAVHRTGAPGNQEMFFGSPKGIDTAVAYAKHKPLGSDFLTWLWYMIDNDPLKLFGPMTHLISLSDKRKITLENYSSKDVESTVIKNDGDNLTEAFVSLSKGAKVTQLGLKLDINDSHWFFSLKDKDLSPISMKMPTTEPAGEGYEGAFLEKISLYDKATGAIEELFKYFVEIWSDDDLREAGHGNIQKWVKRELEA